jgi:hypothetical protein
MKRGLIAQPLNLRKHALIGGAHSRIAFHVFARYGYRQGWDFHHGKMEESADRAT